LPAHDPQPVAVGPDRLEAFAPAARLDLALVGGPEHLVPALEPPEVEAPAAARAAVVPDDAEPARLEAREHRCRELGGHLPEVRERRLPTAARRLDEAAEEEVARRLRDEAHLAVLRNRVVRRQLAGGEDVAGERVAHSG
jgi:hypothetical protein